MTSNFTRDDIMRYKANIRASNANSTLPLDIQMRALMDIHDELSLILRTQKIEEAKKRRDQYTKRKAAEAAIKPDLLMQLKLRLKVGDYVKVKGGRAGTSPIRKIVSMDGDTFDNVQQIQNVAKDFLNKGAGWLSSTGYEKITKLWDDGSKTWEDVRKEFL